MAQPRFNHMELTLPMGSLDAGGVRDDIKRFFDEVFGFESLDVDILKQTALLLRTDPETSQFILITQQKNPIDSPGYDHLGFLYDSRLEVDLILEKCRKYQERDDRVKLKLYEDLDAGGSIVHAFYVKYILPIYFDVQCMEYKTEEAKPARSWRYA